MDGLEDKGGCGACVEKQVLRLRVAQKARQTSLKMTQFESGEEERFVLCTNAHVSAMKLHDDGAPGVLLAS